MLAPLLLAAAAPPAADRTAIEQQVVGIYAPYAVAGNEAAAWDYPIYSAELTALIARWNAVKPKGELDGMYEADWLCLCQDWQPDSFQATIVSIAMTDADTAEVELTLDLGFGGPEGGAHQHLRLKREQGAWKIDDIVAEGLDKGLKQALRETIAADEAAASGQSSTTDAGLLEGTVGAIFQPYYDEANATAAWDYPIYSQEVTALIARWQKVVPEDEPDALNDGDWLCQCQDRDPKGFTVRFDSFEDGPDGTVEANVTLNLGTGGPDAERPMQLRFKPEGGAWKLDDLFAADMPNGLKQALRETIAADEALKSGKRG